MDRVKPDNSSSDFSDDSETEKIINVLRSNEDTKHLAEDFRARQNRIRKRTKQQSSRHTTAARTKRDKICKPCRKINIVQLRDGGCRLSRSFKSLLEAADACPLCFLIVDSLRQKNAEVDRLVRQTETMNVTYGDDGVSDYDFKPSSASKWRGEETFHLSMGPGQDGVVRIDAQVRSEMNSLNDVVIQSTLTIYTDDEEVSKRMGIPLDPRPKGDEKLALIKTWLKQDLTQNLNSPGLDLADRSVVLPRRLIYLDPSRASGIGTLRLIDRREVWGLKGLDGKLGKPRYVTLSHRWGQYQHYVTTKASLGQQRRDIPFADLPQTFQDAVTVTTSLGFHFLWIDALCIVQDDPAEWLQESEIMGDIYRTAAFTIASHCSEDDSEGFISSAFRQKGSAKLYDTQGYQPSVYIRASADLEQDVSRSPLSRRGWVLQERFLSQRILHFTPKMIYWETADHAISEDGPVQKLDSRQNIASQRSLHDEHAIAQIPFSLRTAEQFRLKASINLSSFSTWIQSSAINSRILNGDSAPSSEIGWYRMIEMYSTCQLTRSKDKLAAIAGIAKVLQRKWRVPYLSGIWADRLPMGLWWLHVGRYTPGSERQVDTAPSWSWACKDGPLQFPLAEKSLGFVNCAELYRIENHEGVYLPGSPLWLNGLCNLTIKTPVCDITALFKDRIVTLDDKYRRIFQDDLPIWNSEDNKLWKQDDPPIRLFNVSNARPLEIVDHFVADTFSKGINESIGSNNGRVLTTYDTPPKAFLVMDFANDEGLYDVSQGRHTLVLASVGHFEQQSIDMENEALHMVLVLLQSPGALNFTRIGVGVISDQFLFDLNQKLRWSSLDKKYGTVDFESHVVTIV